MSRIIGIVGLAGAGKNTVADVLIQRYGYKLDSFAKPLKDITSILFDWDRDTVEGIKGRELREVKDEFWSEKFGKDVSIRSMLQFLGTDLFRDHLDKDIWINSFLKRNQDPDKKVVVADVRFPNEIETIKKLGGKIIRVKRGEDPGWLNRVLKHRSDFQGSTDYMEYIALKEGCPIHKIKKFFGLETDIPHISEWAWTESINLISDQIDNDSNLKNLDAKVRAYMDPNPSGSLSLADLGNSGKRSSR